MLKKTAGPPAAWLTQGIAGPRCPSRCKTFIGHFIIILQK